MASREDESPFRSLAGALRAILRRMDAGQDLEVYRLWVDWERVVGGRFAERVQPVEFRNGVLVLAVATTAWRQEMEFLKPELLARIQAYLDDQRVRDLAFVLRRAPAVKRKPATSPLPPQPQPPLEEWDDSEALASVSDPRLAEAFRRLIEARRRRQQRAGSTGEVPAPPQPGEAKSEE